MSADTAARGLLLFAHGARDPRWALPFEQVADQVRARQPGLQVQLAFLEFMAPDIATGAAALATAGCRQIDIVPLFLGAGGHVRKDLPPLLATLRERHVGVSFTLHPAVGEMPALVISMAEIALQLAAPP